MLHTRFMSLFTLPLVAVFACTEVEQPLGDAPAAGRGGDGGSGGTSATGGTAGRAPAGAGTGGSSGGATARGGSGNEPGEAGAPSSGGTGGGTTPDCYSPSAPDGALNGADGCACGASDENECIRVREGDRPHLLSFHCIGGKWASVEDGVCDVPRGCLVRDRLYAEGNLMPSPGGDCNTCECTLDGSGSCTEIGCPGQACPAGTAFGSTCFTCGPGGGCSILELGCVPSCDDARDCSYGVCEDGICQQLCD